MKRACPHNGSVLKICKNLKSNLKGLERILFWVAGFLMLSLEIIRPQFLQKNHSSLFCSAFFLMPSLEIIKPHFLQTNHSSLFCTSSRHIRSSAWQSPIFLICCAEKHSPSHYILGSIPRLAHRCPLFQIFFLLHDTPPQTVVERVGRRHQSDHNFCFWTYFAPHLQVHME